MCGVFLAYNHLFGKNAVEVVTQHIIYKEKNMWSEIKNDLLTLSKFDSSNQLFGAEKHLYNFGPLVSAEKIKSVENKLRVELPEELKRFYMDLGNGVVGPHYGLLEIEKISGYRQDLPYQGIEYFKEQAAKEGDLSDDGYFEIMHDDIKGLITVIHEGCGHEICLITSGENIGNVVYVSCDGFICESNQTLTGLYREWIKDSISVFNEVAILIDSNKSMEEINSICVEKLNCYDARDIAMSIMGVKKPASLFGSGNYKRYHGASQFPWYEKQLQKYRKNKNKPWWKIWG